MVWISGTGCISECASRTRAKVAVWALIASPTSPLMARDWIAEAKPGSSVNMAAPAASVICRLRIRGSSRGSSCSARSSARSPCWETSPAICRKLAAIGHAARQFIELQRGWRAILGKGAQCVGGANQTVGQAADVAWQQHRKPTRSDLAPGSILEFAMEVVQPVGRAAIDSQRRAPLFRFGAIDRFARGRHRQVAPFASVVVHPAGDGVVLSKRTQGFGHHWAMLGEEGLHDEAQVG